MLTKYLIIILLMLAFVIINKRLKLHNVKSKIISFSLLIFIISIFLISVITTLTDLPYKDRLFNKTSFNFGIELGSTKNAVFESIKLDHFVIVPEDYEKAGLSLIDLNSEEYSFEYCDNYQINDIEGRLFLVFKDEKLYAAALYPTNFHYNATDCNYLRDELYVSLGSFELLNAYTLNTSTTIYQWSIDDSHYLRYVADYSPRKIVISLVPRDYIKSDLSPYIVERGNEMFMNYNKEDN